MADAIQNAPTPEEKFPKKLAVNTPEAETEINNQLEAVADKKEVPAPEHDIENTDLDELPEGATVIGGGGVSSLNYHIAAGNSVIQPTPASAFNDDHVGQGGSYVLGEDGVRRVAYDQYFVPGKKKGDDPVAKYRRVA